MVQDSHRQVSAQRFSDRLATHQTPNSAAVVRFNIRKAERIHWFLGLRQAELTIESRQAALDYVERTRRSSDRKQRIQSRKLVWLKGLEAMGLNYLLPITEWIEEIEDSLADAQYGAALSTPYIRDARMELQVAIQERDRIRASHVNDLSASFDELQSQHAEAAMEEGQALFLASRIWAAQHGFPESVGQALFEIAPERREVILQREVELRLGADLKTVVAASLETLSMLPEEQRETALLKAAQLVISEQHQLSHE